MRAQDAVGIDILRLDAVQSRIVSLYAPVAQPYEAEAVPPAAVPQPLSEVFARCVESCMYKATNELLDDLHRNYRLLGTPERCLSPFQGPCDECFSCCRCVMFCCSPELSLPSWTSRPCLQPFHVLCVTRLGYNKWQGLIVSHFSRQPFREGTTQN